MAEKKMQMKRMHIEPAEMRDGKFGGAMVEHEMKEKMAHSGKMGMMSHYQEPEKHVFGADEGHEMLAHIANHLNIPEAGDMEEDEDEGAVSRSAG